MKTTDPGDAARILQSVASVRIMLDATSFCNRCAAAILQKLPPFGARALRGDPAVQTREDGR
jgi:hypothetical protein